MAGQEIEGDNWDQSFGLDLLPPSVCTGFRAVLHLCAELGEQGPLLTKLALDQAWHTCMTTHASKKIFTEDLTKLLLASVH